MNNNVANTSWKRWRRLWRGWIVIPTGIGISVLTVLHWRRFSKNRSQSTTTTTVTNDFRITCYRAVPFRMLSRVWGWLSSCYVPLYLRCWLYTKFANICGANLEEAADPLDSYNSLCEFFVRPLKNGVRPIAEFEPIVSPADGHVISARYVNSCQVEQIKGVTYTIKSFLGEPAWPSTYESVYGKEIDDEGNVIMQTSSVAADESSNSSVIIPTIVSYSSSKSSAHSHRCNSGPVIAASSYYQPLNGSMPVSSEYDDMLRLDLLSSTILCNEDPSAIKTADDNWMLGWLIFYFRFCATVLLKNSFYIGFQLIYGFKTTNTLVSGASFLKSNFFNINFSSGSTESRGDDNTDSGSSPAISNQSDDNDTDEDSCESSALQDDDWNEYKKKLLHRADNRLYQLVVYLAPGDYHRFHSPVDWHVSFRRHFQGELLSVHPKISKWIPELFSLNERVVYVGEWEHGFFSMVAVGATNVGSIRVYTDETLQTNTRKWRTGERHRDQSLNINWKKGEGIGEFRLGSTIVLLFEAPKDFQFNVKPDDRIKVGQPIVALLH